MEHEYRESSRSSQEGGSAVVPGDPSKWTEEPSWGGGVRPPLRQAGDMALFLHAVVGIFRVLI